MEIRATGRAMRSQTTAAEDWIKTLKVQSTNAQTVFEKLANKSSSTDAHLQAEMVAVDESLDVEKGRVKSLKHELVAEVEK